MGVNQLVYARVLEREMKNGKSFEDAHQIASDEGSIDVPATQAIQAEEAKPSWVSSLKDKIVQYFSNQRNQSDEQLQKQGYSLPEIMRFRSKGKLIKSNVGQ
jgi:hypothetical protein